MAPRSVKEMWDQFDSVDSYQDFCKILDANFALLSDILTPAVLRWITPDVARPIQRESVSWFIANEIIKDGCMPDNDRTPLTDMDIRILMSYRAGAGKDDQKFEHAVPVDANSAPGIENIYYRGQYHPALSEAWDR